MKKKLTVAQQFLALFYLLTISYHPILASNDNCASLFSSTNVQKNDASYTLKDIIEYLGITSRSVKIVSEDFDSFVKAASSVDWGQYAGQFINVEYHDHYDPKQYGNNVIPYKVAHVPQFVLNREMIPKDDLALIDELIRKTPRKPFNGGFRETGIISILLASGKRFTSKVGVSNSNTNISFYDFSGPVFDEYNNYQDGSELKEILYIHTHGKFAPLSVPDQIAFQKEFDNFFPQQLPEGDIFRMRSYAVPIEANGNLVFRQSKIPKPPKSEIDRYRISR